MSEDILQSQLWLWAWNELPISRFHMWAVPNGMHSQPAIIAREKAKGLLPGVWDLHVYYNRCFHIIETKVGHNGLTVTRVVKGKKVYGQKEWGELMAAHGATRHIYYNIEDGKKILLSIFSP